jgi:glucoamylase
MNYTNPYVMATARVLDQTFKDLYPINRVGDGLMGAAIGRYPEDLYRGEHVNNGANPWVLLTAAMAQYYYRASIEHRELGNLDAADQDLQVAEDYLRRVHYHAPADGALAEQIEKNSGFMTSASDLTWSHTEVLDAFSAREQALSAAGR